MRSPAHVRVTSACATNSLTVRDICPAMKISQERLREPGLVVIDVTAAEEHADHEVSDGDRGAPDHQARHDRREIQGGSCGRRYAHVRASLGQPSGVIRAP